MITIRATEVVSREPSPQFRRPGLSTNIAGEGSMPRLPGPKSCERRR
jgi:hypothetical protein